MTFIGMVGFSPDDSREDTEPAEPSGPLSRLEPGETALVVESPGPSAAPKVQRDWAIYKLSQSLKDAINSRDADTVESVLGPRAREHMIPTPARTWIDRKLFYGLTPGDTTRLAEASYSFNLGKLNDEGFAHGTLRFHAKGHSSQELDIVLWKTAPDATKGDWTAMLNEAPTFDSIRLKPRPQSKHSAPQATPTAHGFAR